MENETVLLAEKNEAEKESSVQNNDTAAPTEDINAIPTAQTAEQTAAPEKPANSVISAITSDPKKKKTVVIAAVGIVIAIILICVISSGVSSNKKIGEIEDMIYSFSDNVYEYEDAIISTYEIYNSLSSGAKRKVQNREKLLNLYKQLEAVVNERKNAAAQVDGLIAAIDSSNIYAKASTTKAAVIAYNNLEEKAYQYLENEDALYDAYNEVRELNVAVTKDNLFDLFVIKYSVGDKNNYGAGVSIEQDGYDIDLDRNGGTITPSYDVDARNDYATPVYIYVQARYPDLISSCHFGLDLHQTYTGLGLVDSDVHEFTYQQGVVNYDSSMNIGKYVVYVENNDSGSGLLNLLGLSVDWTDMTHEMNPFDVTRIEYYDINGSVAY